MMEFGLWDPRRFKTYGVGPDKRFQLGPFEAEAVRVTHSIPDCCGLFLRCDDGTIVHTGDWKARARVCSLNASSQALTEFLPAFVLHRTPSRAHIHSSFPLSPRNRPQIDEEPIDGENFDRAAFEAIGNEGVTLFMSDSTNAIAPGRSASETLVKESLIVRFLHTPPHLASPRGSALDAHQIPSQAACHGTRVGSRHSPLTPPCPLASTSPSLAAPRPRVGHRPRRRHVLRLQHPPPRVAQGGGGRDEP